jgi:osmotically-inducible protein OsmY
MNRTLCAALFGLVCAAGACKSGADQAADNTGRNADDKGVKSAKVADQADNDKTDVDLTQQIRQAVVADDSLSMNAKNVKIIVEDQVVTLRGPVGSEAERATVASIASTYAGARRVVNELELAP